MKLVRGKKYDVVGVVQAIVDILAYVDQKFLDRHNLKKGTMNHISEERAEFFYDYLLSIKKASGGSASNTIAGLASFGAKTAIIGKVKDDELGAIFKRDIGMAGVDFKGVTSKDGSATGRCFIAVSREDADRTMSTYLGASVELNINDIDIDTIKNSTIMHYEGYFLDRESSKDVLLHCIDIAHRSNHVVSMTLSDSRCVSEHRSSFMELLKNVDILFANENEILTLFETNDFELALSKAKDYCKIVIVTRGKDGSDIVSSAERIHVPAAADPASIVDTTGAGDLYASGFLFGLIKGMDLKQCGELGSMAAAEIISHIGAKPEISLNTLLDKLK
jgi:sugar/nucleoside kinase (ribokinase family)